MWDNSRPKQEWSMDQLIARYMEMWQDLAEAVREQNEDPVTPEQLSDRRRREIVGLRARMIRKIAWEMGEVADEWARRDGDGS